MEKGNWAICQNFKCAKFMDNAEDLRIHARNCQYLWKCKHCSIEFEKEERVRKHHCCDSTDDSEDEIEVVEVQSDQVCKL